MQAKPVLRPRFALLEHSQQAVHELQSTTTVGRENTDLVFPELTSMSRRHFRIIIEGEDAFVEDMGSSNGTYLNGIRLEPHQRAFLKNSDSIIAGKALFTFQEHLSIEQRAQQEEISIPNLSQEIENVATPLVSSPAPAVAREKAGEPQKEESLLSISLLNFDRFKRSPLEAKKRTEKKRAKQKKERRQELSNVFSYSKHLITLIFIGVLIWRFRVEWAAIDQLPTQPFSVRDLKMRFAFSVGMAYLAMIFAQVILSAFTKRWWVAALLLAVSIFSGGLVGTELEKIAQFQEAKQANLKAWDPHRYPAQKK